MTKTQKTHSSFRHNTQRRLSDRELYNLCLRYGENALAWRQKFIGLLPEVNRRKLYKKHGFHSIFEFAAKLAGVSHEQVRLTLNLRKNFKGKPALQKLLIKGEVSVNKLARINSVATRENEAFWAEQVKILPNRAIEALVRDQKACERDQILTFTEEKSARADVDTMPAQPVKSRVSLDFELDDEIKSELNNLHKKGLDANALLKEFLSERKRRITEEKQKISVEMRNKTVSRQIPVQIKKLISKEYGKKCAVPSCTKRAEHLHHTLPFAMTSNHNPEFIVPLCKAHHIVAHSINKRFFEARMEARGVP